MKNYIAALIVNGISVFIYSLILVSLFLDKTDREKFMSKRNLVIFIVGVSLVSSLLDGASALFEGEPGMVTTKLIIVIASSVTDFLIIMYISIYQFSTVKLNRKVASWIIAFYSLIFAFYIAFLIIGAIDKEGIYFDANGRITQGKHWIVYVSLALSLMVIDIIVMLVCFAKHRQAGILLTFNIIPIGCMALEYYRPGYSWMRLGNIAVVTLLFILSYVEIARKRSQTAIELEKSRNELVVSQIRPHFLFNTLTAASELCHTEPEQAAELLVNFSRYLRANLDSMSNPEPIEFEKELRHIKAYTDIEQLRFGDRVKMVLDIGVSDFLIPAITVQPLVENSIRHGISEWETSGTVAISTWERDGFICIRVSDTGHGFKPEHGPKEERSHLGIANVRQRIESFGGTFDIRSEIGVGTTATIRLPRKENEKYARGEAL